MGIEPLPVGVGYLFLCSPAFSLVPQIQNLDFLYSLFPKIVFVPLFPSILDFCSPEINGLIPLFPQMPGSTYNLCFEQKYEKYQSFLSEIFKFLEVKFPTYLNRRVFVKACQYLCISCILPDE